MRKCVGCVVFACIVRCGSALPYWRHLPPSEVRHHCRQVFCSQYQVVLHRYNTLPLGPSLCRLALRRLFLRHRNRRRRLHPVSCALLNIFFAAPAIPHTPSVATIRVWPLPLGVSSLSDKDAMTCELLVVNVILHSNHRIRWFNSSSTRTAGVTVKFKTFASESWSCIIFLLHLWNAIELFVISCRSS